MPMAAPASTIANEAIAPKPACTCELLSGGRLVALLALSTDRSACLSCPNDGGTSAEILRFLAIGSTRVDRVTPSLDSVGPEDAEATAAYN